MSALIFAFVAALLAGAGSREQLLTAAEVVRRGRSAGLLAAALAATVASCALGAGLGLAAMGLPARARLLLAGLALVLAALALGWRSRRAIADPATLPLPRTLAFAAVLAAIQLNGPLPLGLAAVVAVTAAWPAAFGGAVVGAMMPLTAAWSAGKGLAQAPMRGVRIAAAALLAVAGIVLLLVGYRSGG